MKIKTIASLGIAICYSLFSTAQNIPPTPKQLAAKRTTQKVTIDGKIDEAAWKDAAVANGLIEFRPKVGAPENADTRSETYLMYDDEGIYFGGYLYERTKDSISAELRGRDGFGNNDFIGIIFDTYNDKLNGFEYFVTPLNEQMDAKVSPGNNDNGGEDFSWNAVWESGAVINADGWSFEMFIPFSAIRFGKGDVQNWGLNITRRRQKTGQQYMWNPIDPNVNGFLTQEGFWTGVTKIKPPLRLQFSPYFSVYANHYKANIPGVKNWTSQVNGGMDVKYGINQAFTLDATLIPDFGQVQSDNKVLNLSPFEVQFNENRAFFTEGTELFSKGGLFYSRRIGVQSVYSDGYSVGGGETVVKDPVEAKLINATKISGRTQKGLGIAMLNALTKPRYATIEDNLTEAQRKVQTEPLTNFNVFVLDQTLKHNSSVSLVNTSVLRSGSAYDANVTAGLFDFNDKKNTWNVGGKAAVSNLIGIDAQGKTRTGYSQSLYFGKTSGRFNFNFNHSLADTKYTHADLGYFTNSNYLNHNLWLGYRWTEPKKWYNRIFLNFNASISNLLSQIQTIETKYQRSEINFNGNIQTKKLSWLGFYIAYNPKQNDFYEPRWEGKYFTRGASAIVDLWYESNSAKKYSIYTEVAARKYFKFYNTVAADINFSQTYRFNSKLSISHRLNFYPRYNSMGFSAIDTLVSGGDYDSFFGRRKVNTIEDILSAKYNFTNRMGITFRMRHYVSSVKYSEFFTVNETGKLESSTYNKNKNRNLNYFNIDMVYTWQFAPGSFINVVWKDFAEYSSDQFESRYFKNLSNTLETNQFNNLSVKVIYFFDYLQLKNHKKKKA